MVDANTGSIDVALGALLERGGSDLLLLAGSPPLARVDGELSSLDGPKLTPPDTEQIAREVLGDSWDELVASRELDFSFNWEGRARFRANAYHQRGSVALAFRVLPFHIPSCDELGLPTIVQAWTKLPQGLVLVTGPTGSGKSTTLASMIDAINTTRACHIVTIEDPVEYLHPHKRSAVSQREVGHDTASFARALRSALREDPDVLLVGEMRDLETIAAALTAAETGHLVFATLHTNDAAQSLDRIVDAFPPDQQAQIRVQLGATLQGVASQRLLARIGGGRVAAFEILVATPAVRNLIRTGKTAQLRNVVATSVADGMTTLERSLSELVARGIVAREESLAVSLYPLEIRP